MKSCRALMALTVLLASNWSSLAEDNMRSYLIFADVNCVSWTQARKRGPTNRERLTMEAWTLGYVSRANGASAVGKDFLSKISAEDVWAWFDAYCRSHPLEKIADSAQIFLAELQNH